MITSKETDSSFYFSKRPNISAAVVVKGKVISELNLLVHSGSFRGLSNTVT